MRIVIDTNLWISAFISKNFRNRLFLILENTAIDIISSKESIEELESVVSRAKFRKYMTKETFEILFHLILARLNFITVVSVITLCRDPKDDFLLALCKDGNVDYLISGDKGLLILNPFENTEILTLTEFEDILLNQ
jgi:hypothetical protein